MNTRPQAWLDQARNNMELALLADSRAFTPKPVFLPLRQQKKR